MLPADRVDEPTRASHFISCVDISVSDPERLHLHGPERPTVTRKKSFQRLTESSEDSVMAVILTRRPSFRLLRGGHSYHCVMVNLVST